jgi:cobalamin biosynthesis Mg chelatase CobN
MNTRFTHLISLVLVCMLAITFTSAQALAQKNIFDKTKEGVQKGAETVGKGVKKGAHETKEGAEAVGHGAKKAVTGEDREKGSEYQTTQPAPRPSGTMPAESGKSRMSESKTRAKGLPRTAGEFPLLALSGGLALAGAALSTVVRRRRSD